MILSNEFTLVTFYLHPQYDMHDMRDAQKHMHAHTRTHTRTVCTLSAFNDLSGLYGLSHRTGRPRKLFIPSVEHVTATNGNPFGSRSTIRPHRPTVERRAGGGLPGGHGQTGVQQTRSPSDRACLRCNGFVSNGLARRRHRTSFAWRRCDRPDACTYGASAPSPLFVRVI